MPRYNSIMDLPEGLREKAEILIGQQKNSSAPNQKTKERGGGSKYRNRKCVVRGIGFDSEMEGRRYLVLCDMLARGEICKLKLQPEFTITESYLLPDGKRVKAMRYRADFSYEKNGELVIEDVKTSGTKTRVFINKSKSVYEKYGVCITLVEA